jgi:hypothetical protein
MSENQSTGKNHKPVLTALLCAPLAALHAVPAHPAQGSVADGSAEKRFMTGGAINMTERSTARLVDEINSAVEFRHACTSQPS